MAAKRRRGFTRQRKDMVEQRFHLTEREHAQLRAISEANEEKHIEIFRRLLREEYRHLVTEGVIPGPLVPKGRKK